MVEYQIGFTAFLSPVNIRHASPTLDHLSQRSTSHCSDNRLRAFTLIEVVMALGICSFALVSLASLMPMALDRARNAVEISRGATVMQQVAAELSQSHFNQVTALGQTPSSALSISMALVQPQQKKSTLRSRRL